MDDATYFRWALLLVGLVPIGLSLFGLCSGMALLPTNHFAGQARWVFRKDNPGEYWVLVVVQMGCGLYLASAPYWF
jgi:hypothetical protein